MAWVESHRLKFRSVEFRSKVAILERLWSWKAWSGCKTGNVKGKAVQHQLPSPGIRLLTDHFCPGLALSHYTPPSPSIGPLAMRKQERDARCDPLRFCVAQARPTSLFAQI